MGQASVHQRGRTTCTAMIQMDSLAWTRLSHSAAEEPREKVASTSGNNIPLQPLLHLVGADSARMTAPGLECATQTLADALV